MNGETETTTIATHSLPALWKYSDIQIIIIIGKWWFGGIGVVRDRIKDVEGFPVLDIKCLMNVDEVIFRT